MRQVWQQMSIWSTSRMNSPTLPPLRRVTSVPLHQPVTFSTAQARRLPPAGALAQLVLTRNGSQSTRVPRTSSRLPPPPPEPGSIAMNEKADNIVPGNESNNVNESNGNSSEAKPVEDKAEDLVQGAKQTTLSRGLSAVPPPPPVGALPLGRWGITLTLSPRVGVMARPQGSRALRTKCQKPSLRRRSRQDEAERGGRRPTELVAAGNARTTKS